MNQTKVFNDPVHGSIELPSLCVRMIDTPQFQRLRYIKQLGGCYFVFPGGSHNRFEHSIGVSHLAGQLVKSLQSRQQDLNITDNDIICLYIAGLCHDLGHGPFSHMFEVFMKRQGQNWKHEMASVQMFDHLLKENNINELDEVDRTFIKELIVGPLPERANAPGWPYDGRGKEKSFLYEIIANRRNGIDVDKWDYFARDCHHLGISSSFDVHRFMTFCRVIDVEGEKQICYRDKEINNIYDMFYTRSILHRRAYKHKTVKIIEHMIMEAFEKAVNNVLIEGKDGKPCKITECINDVDAYSKLTDQLYLRILYSSDPELSPARDILHRIECRKLYKFLKEYRVEDARHAIEEVKKKEGYSDIEEDIVMLSVIINYGKNTKNPVDDVRFYNKNNENKAFQIKKEQVSAMLPACFCDQYVRIYSRNGDATNSEKITGLFHETVIE